MSKIPNDKYYTSPKLANYCVGKVKEIISDYNITEYIEPSAGSGVFLKYLDKPYRAYDIEPEDSRVMRADWLSIDLKYKTGRCVIGNPPFGNSLNLAQKFYKKSVEIADYVAFILPISQLDNSNFLYEFDLIYSKDLGVQQYSDRKLHCCFNIYARPVNGNLNSKPVERLKDITIYRQDSSGYDNKPFDVRMCYWGDATAGKILKDGEHYSGEYKIKVNNEKLKEDIIRVLTTFDWNSYVKCIAMKRIKQYHIVEVLKNNVKGIK